MGLKLDSTVIKCVHVELLGLPFFYFFSVFFSRLDLLDFRVTAVAFLTVQIFFTGRQDTRPGQIEGEVAEVVTG